MLIQESTQNQFISHYKIIKKIGQGGMATVYEAYERKKKRRVALKVLLPQLASKKVTRQRFLREARVGMELDHEGIVKVHETGEDERPFIAMELVKGRTLDTIIEQRSLPYKKVISIGTQLSDALIAAHKQGVIHRDIKPRNIMVTKDQVKIMDFGLARVLDTSSITEQHEILGTLYYMSPEQVIGDTIDQRSDIFSLGVVLYQMLTARRPFDGEHVGTIIHAILYADPVGLCEIDRSIPKEIEQVVFKALQKMVDTRYQHMTDIRDDLVKLENVLKGESITLIASDVIVGETFDKDRGLHSELVGREKEMAALQRYLAEMLRGRSSAVLVSGEAGIGKSRLAWELGQRARKQDVQYFVGRCAAYATIPYQPVLEVIRHYFEYKGIRTVRTLNTFIIEYAAHLHYRRDIVAALAIEQTAKDINIIDEKQLWDTAAELFQVIARDRPAVIHLDDLHWADAPTLAMLTYLLRTLNGTRLSIVGTYRPEDITGKDHPLHQFLKIIKREHLCHTLPLRRLDKERTSSLINSVFENSDFTDRFIDSLFEETEGNPLFVLEVLKLLRDENVVIQHDTRWRTASDEFEIQIPHKITEVILRRVKKLSKEEREIIDLAAVMGPSFRSDPLVHCLGQPRMKIFRHLQHLESSHNLVHATKLGYQFDHGKIKDVVYNNLIPELRREYHKVIGEYLKNIYSGKDEHAGEIAHHLVEANLREESLVFFMRAGEYSRKVFANEDALANYNRGLRIVEELMINDGSVETEKMKAQILRGVGHVKCHTGEYEESIDDLETMIELAGSIKDDRERMLGLLEIGDVFYKKSEYSISYARYGEALRICRELGDKQYESQLLLKLAVVCYHKKTIDESEKLLTDALKILKNSKKRAHEGEAFGYLALSNIMQSKYDRGFMFFRKALRLLRDEKQKHTHAYFLSQMGSAYRHSGQYRKALCYLKQALRIQEEIGDKANQVMSLNNIGITYDVCGNYALATEYYERGNRIASHIGDLTNLEFTLNNLGWMYHYVGDDRKALDYNEKALAIARKINDNFGENAIIRDRCWLYVNKGEYDQAFKYCNQALDLARVRKDKRSECLSYHYLANIHSEQGDLGKALMYAQNAVKIAEQIGIEKDCWFCYTHLSLCCRRVGQTRRASASMKKAMAIMKISDSRRMRGWLFYFHGVRKFRNGLLQDALKDIMTCMKIAKSTGEVLQNVHARLVAGEIFFRKREYSKASRHAQRALHISQSFNRRFEIAKSLILNACILMKKGDFESAAEYAKDSMKIANENGMKTFLWRAHHILGDVYMKLRQYDLAQQEFLEAKKVVDTIAAGLDHTLRKSYFKTKEIKDLFVTLRKLQMTDDRNTGR